MSSEEDLFDLLSQQEPINEQEEISQIDKYLKFDKVRLDNQVRGGSPNNEETNSIQIFPQNFVFNVPPLRVLPETVHDPDLALVSQVVNDGVQAIPKEPKSPFKKDSYSRRMARYYENKKFNVILAKMTDREYTNQELIEMYNEEFETGINCQSLGKMRWVKENLIAVRKTDPKTHKRHTYYRKK